MNAANPDLEAGENSFALSMASRFTHLEDARSVHTTPTAVTLLTQRTQDKEWRMLSMKMSVSVWSTPTEGPAPPLLRNPLHMSGGFNACIPPGGGRPDGFNLAATSCIANPDAVSAIENYRSLRLETLNMPLSTKGCIEAIQQLERLVVESHQARVASLIAELKDKGDWSTVAVVLKTISRALGGISIKAHQDTHSSTSLLLLTFQSDAGYIETAIEFLQRSIDAMY